MVVEDTAAFVLAPFIDLDRPSRVVSPMAAGAVVHWMQQRGDPTGWGSDRLPSRRLRPALVAVGLVPSGDPLPDGVRRRTAGEHPLWVARLLLRLGRFDDAERAATAVPDSTGPDARGWRDLMLSSLRGLAPPLVDPACTPSLRLASALAGLDGPSRGSTAVDGALAEARCVVDTIPDEATAVLASARVALRELRLGRVPERLDDVLAGLLRPDPGFLLREARWALLVGVARHDPARAPAAVRTALLLDPAGADTLLLAARTARAEGADDLARRLYRSAARHGLVERHAALTGLIDLAAGAADPARDPSLLGAVADLLTIDPAPAARRRAALVDRSTALLDTPAADIMRTAPVEGVYPLPVERYRPFLDLTLPRGLDPRDVPPVAIHTPLMSCAALLEHREPWFSEIHPQRATAALFRTELRRTAELLGRPGDATSATFATWRDAEDGCPTAVRDLLDAGDDLPLLDRAMLARLLSAVGFHAEAMQAVPGPDEPAPTPEAAYALASWIFAEQMLTTGRDVDLEPHFQILWAQLGDDPHYARMAVVVSINATVNAARRRAPDVIATWRHHGERALAVYTALPEVDAFDAAVMTSRWYRAMGFLPFLTGDRDLLVSDMDRWLGIATDLVGHDPHTRIIAADNYFPAVETAIRTHTFLGDHATALQLVEKLATEIDPVDPKTWLTAGELRHRAGDVEGALHAYEHAGHLQFPYGRLSWFNAGQCHEQLGHADEAVECYRRSLMHSPTGVTPVRRLRDLHAAGALGDDADLLAAWTATTPAWTTVQERS